MPKGQPDKGYAMTPQREKVLRILAAEGGSLDDEAGLVVSRLRERTGHDSTHALSMVIKQLETAGLIKRDVAGRRTYHLELVTAALTPEDRARIGAAAVSGHVDHPVAAPAPTVLLENDEPTEPANYDETDPPGSSDNSDGTDYRKLADELLKSALSALSHKAGDPKLKLRIAELEARLVTERQRADDLAVQLIERGEEVIKLKESLRIAEHNLSVERKKHAKQQAARGSDTVAEKLTPRERRELAELQRLMQERPTS